VNTPSPPYQDLTPDRILNAVESLGLRCDGRLLALNSYENRVYQVGIEDSAPVIAKFYRPLRWTDEAILEEHRFTLELAEREIPVVAPLVDETGRTLHEFEGFRFTISPRQPGRAPELDDPDTLEWMGRFIGRIHAVGAIEPFAHRPTITIETFGDAPAMEFPVSSASDLSGAELERLDQLELRIDELEQEIVQIKRALEQLGPKPTTGYMEA
jgi:Ser/Thr protein kinase RdoA (MazF antagonist)